MGVNGHWYVELEKQAWWRGQQHHWVNRYIMSGAQPSSADAITVIQALKTIESKIYPVFAANGGVGFIQGRAYPSGKGTYFAFVNYNISGATNTATGFTGTGAAYTTLQFGATLENSLVIETRLNGLSSTGKTVFLRKFIRGISTISEINNGSPISAGDLAQVTLTTAPWQTGMGANAWVVIGGNGEQAAGAPTPLAYIGNRQVPKGRKKKATTSGLLSEISKVASTATKVVSAVAEDLAG